MHLLLHKKACFSLIVNLAKLIRQTENTDANKGLAEMNHVTYL